MRAAAQQGSMRADFPARRNRRLALMLLGFAAFLFLGSILFVASRH